MAIVELHSAFARLVRDGILTPADITSLIARVDNDVAAGTLFVAAVSRPRLQAASTILATHGLKANLRTLDAIHLATAKAFHERSSLTAFVAADEKLLAAAGPACGLPALDVR